MSVQQDGRGAMPPVWKVEGSSRAYSGALHYRGGGEWVFYFGAMVQSWRISPFGTPKFSWAPACPWIAPVSSCWFRFLSFFSFLTPFFPLYVLSHPLTPSGELPYYTRTCRCDIIAMAKTIFFSSLLRLTQRPLKLCFVTQRPLDFFFSFLSKVSICHLKTPYMYFRLFDEKWQICFKRFFLQVSSKFKWFFIFHFIFKILFTEKWPHHPRTSLFCSLPHHIPLT